MKLIRVLAIGVVVAVAVTGCTSLFDTTPAPAAAPPVIVTNNIPSGADSGTTVLLAVVGIVAFLLLAGLIVAGMSWANEKRRRMAAEDAVVALTGRPMSQLGLMMAPPVSAERLQTMAMGVTLPEAKELVR